MSNFRDWDSNSVVWDALAFGYSRNGMVNDALLVLAYMKDLNLPASTPTYNSLLHNLKHTDLLWDTYGKMRDNGAFENEYTS